MKMWRGSAVQRKEDISTEEYPLPEEEHCPLAEDTLWDRRLSKRLLTWFLVATRVTEKDLVMRRISISPPW